MKVLVVIDCDCRRFEELRENFWSESVYHEFDPQEFEMRTMLFTRLADMASIRVVTADHQGRLAPEAYNQYVYYAAPGPSDIDELSREISSEDLPIHK